MVGLYGVTWWCYMVLYGVIWCYMVIIVSYHITLLHVVPCKYRLCMCAYDTMRGDTTQHYCLRVVLRGVTKMILGENGQCHRSYWGKWDGEK